MDKVKLNQNCSMAVSMNYIYKKKKLRKKKMCLSNKLTTDYFTDITKKTITFCV